MGQVGLWWDEKVSQMTAVQARKTVQNIPASAGGVLRRKCDKCRKRKPLLQRSAAGPDAETVPPIVHEVLRSPGQPLDEETRAFMEPRFGHDFSRVRVHTDAKAAESARAVNARAYTAGRDVVFGENQYNPHTMPDLLVHELTHVIQQNRMAPIGDVDLKLGPSDDAFEDQARNMASMGDFSNGSFQKAIQTFKSIPDAVRIQRGLFTPLAPGGGFRGLMERDRQRTSCQPIFRVVVHPVLGAATPGPNGTTRIRGHHVVEARFSSRCNCSEFEYRQYIAGVAMAYRGAQEENLARLFQYTPGGSLPIDMQEDGMTNCPSVNYGRREQRGQASTTATCGENRYTDDTGRTDQPNGCTYRGEDFPELIVHNLNSGDTVDLLIEFRGEIEHNHRTILTRSWTTVETPDPIRTP